uniref:Uncharacterized protein n=1 Tax=Arundo donax TaxID=35708 RepID=A0A0A9FAK6_ARUDO
MQRYNTATSSSPCKVWLEWGKH